MPVVIDQKKCTGCGICEDVCPMDAIKVENGEFRVQSNCLDCKNCIDECPNDAIRQGDRRAEGGR